MMNAHCEIWYCEYYSKPSISSAFLPTAITNFAAAAALLLLPLPLFLLVVVIVIIIIIIIIIYCWQWVEMVEVVGLMCFDGC